MLRKLRPLGRRSVGLLTLVSLSVTSLVTRAADLSFESQSTLAPQIAPQALSIDAAISSMVRRGLLADVAPAAERTAERTAALPSRTMSTAPAVNAASPSTSTSTAASGWRTQGVALTPPTTPLVKSTPVTPTTPAPLGWRPSGTGSMPTLAAPAFEFPDLPAADETTPPAESPDQQTAESAPAAPLMAPPALVAERTPSPTPEDELADEPAAQAIEPTAEPRTSDDPLPHEALAPIDELPETPAPAHDAPGDPQEPELGDEGLEGMLPAEGDANRPAATAPAASSLSGQSMTPVGEPDRIELPSENISPPSNPETYQENDDVPPPTKLAPLTRNQIALRDKVRRVLKYYYSNPLNTGDRSPWEVMHCMLSFEVHSRILKGGPHGEPITAVGWLCFNQPCKGRTLMYLNQDGDLRVKVGPALQGHHGQLLALLAQARVRTDYPMQVEGKKFTVADLIEEEKATCYPKTELTFKLIGLQRYLDINAHWMNDQGMQWDFPTLLREEMRQPVRTAACGGTHRLGGLILTVKKRQRSGLPVDGEYAAAQRFVANYVNYAYRLQNPDGSFSTEWFKGPGAEEDIDRRLKTTGHQLEFLIYASGEGQLQNQRLVRAVNYLSNIMWANRGRDWEAGPLGHAVHSLVLYDRLMFAPHDQNPSTPSVIAQQPEPQRKPTTTRRAARR